MEMLATTIQIHQLVGSGGGANKSTGSDAGAGGPALLGAYPGGSMPGGNHYCGAGGGGAGGAGGRGSDDPSNRTASDILTDGLGGIGLQVPTTFRDPKAIYDGVHLVLSGILLAVEEVDYSTHHLGNPDRGGKGGGGYGGSGNPGVGNSPGTGSKGGDGQSGTGGGGGGAGSYNDATKFQGGRGGSGIVLIAYPT